MQYCSGPVRPRTGSVHMTPMTDFITYRETTEYTIALPRNDYEADQMYGEGERRDVKVISKEEIGRRHEVDYSLGCDLTAELYFLLKDGVRIFESRSHDAVVDHCGSLGDDVSQVFRFGDLENPDKSWDVMAVAGRSLTTPAGRTVSQDARVLVSSGPKLPAWPGRPRHHQ